MANKAALISIKDSKETKNDKRKMHISSGRLHERKRTNPNADDP